MTFKELKNLLNTKNVRFINPPHLREIEDFSNIRYFLLTKKKNLYFVNFIDFDGRCSPHPLDKEILKYIEIKENPSFVHIEEKNVEKPISTYKPEEVMKLNFFQELLKQYPGASIIPEYTHSALQSRADFVVFSKGEIHVFELKSHADNLNRLFKQVRDYKRYANKIFIVCDKKHISGINDKKIDENLIIYENNLFKPIVLNKNNVIRNEEDLIWFKEKENLFSGLKDHTKFSQEEKNFFLKGFFNYNELSALVLEERYKELSDYYKFNSLNVIHSRSSFDIKPAKKSLFSIYGKTAQSYWNIFKKEKK